VSGPQPDHNVHTEAKIFAGMGHDMMLEPRWPAVAEQIYTWLAPGGCDLLALQRFRIQNPKERNRRVGSS
jgi:hypothetical protein